jgi:hypothetical protein
MWGRAPYSALTATLKIRNVTAKKFAEEPGSYGPLAVRLSVPDAERLEGDNARPRTAVMEVRAHLAKVRSL